MCHSLNLKTNPMPKGKHAIMPLLKDVSNLQDRKHCVGRRPPNEHCTTVLSPFVCTSRLLPSPPLFVLPELGFRETVRYLKTTGMLQAVSLQSKSFVGRYPECSGIPLFVLYGFYSLARLQSRGCLPLGTRCRTEPRPWQSQYLIPTRDSQLMVAWRLIRSLCWVEKGLAWEQSRLLVYPVPASKC